MFFIIWFIAIIINFSILLFSGMTYKADETSLFWISLFSVVPSAIYLMERRKFNTTKLHILGTLAALLFIALFALRGFSLSLHFGEVYGINLPDYFTLALSLNYALLGFGCFLAGYHFMKNIPNVVRLGDRIFQGRSYWNLGCVIYFVLGNVGMLFTYLWGYSFLFQDSGYSRLGAIPQYFGVLGLIALFILLEQKGLNFFFKVFIVICHVGVTLVCSAMWGMRGLFLGLIVFTLIYVYLTRKISVFFSGIGRKLILVAIIFLQIIIFCILSEYKSHIISGGVLNVSGRDRLLTSKKILSDIIYKKEITTDGDIGTKFINRVGSAFDNLSILIANTPQIWNYQYGKTLLLIPITFIPRAVWPDKPASSLDGKFYEDYLGYEKKTGLGAANYSLVGDCYLNFHIPGIIVGMFLFGIFCRIFQNFCIGNYPYTSRLTGNLVFSYFAFTLSSLDQAASTVLSNIFIYMMVIMPFLLLISHRINGDNNSIKLTGRRFLK